MEDWQIADGKYQTSLFQLSSRRYFDSALGKPRAAITRSNHFVDWSMTSKEVTEVLLPRRALATSDPETYILDFNGSCLSMMDCPSGLARNSSHRSPA